MRLKTFSAATMDEAMRRVRQELGDDAVILSTKRDGKSGVLVTAGLDDEPLASEETALAASAPRAFPQVDTAALDGLDRIADRLEFNGVPAAIADRLLNAAAELSTENPTMALAAALDAQFAFAPLIDEAPARPLLFIGPPRARKTPSLAQLPTRLGAHRLIVTKLDTVRRLGSLLAAAAGGGLALCEFGLSPQISDGLVPMNPVSLARLLMGERIELPSLNPAAMEAAE